MLRRLLLPVALLASLSACGGLSEGDEALCERVREINRFGLEGGSDTSPSAVFRELQGAEDEDLAQVGRDYLADDNAAADVATYEDRAHVICFGKAP